MTEKEKVIEWLNINCDPMLIDYGFAVVKCKGDERNGWEFGCCKIIISETGENLLAYTDSENSKHFSFSEILKLQDYIISENEKADANSLYHRLFK